MSALRERAEWRGGGGGEGGRGGGGEGKGRTDGGRVGRTVMDDGRPRTWSGWGAPAGSLFFYKL